MADLVTYRAIARYIHISPPKIRRVADQVRRCNYIDAIAILDNLPHKGARILRKVIASAAANALNRNNQIIDKSLFVHELRVDEGPRHRRIWLRGRGRADILYKRLSHITAVVAETSSLSEKKQEK